MRRIALIQRALPAGWMAGLWPIAVLLIGLATLANVFWNPPARPPILRTESHANLSQLAANAFPTATEEFGVITERPLFHANRRAWTPPPPPRQTAAPVTPLPPPPAPPRQPFGNYLLIGTMTSGAERFVLLRPSSGSRTVILREGQSVDGWTLRGISEGRARFESGSSTHELVIPNRRQVGGNG